MFNKMFNKMFIPNRAIIRNIILSLLGVSLLALIAYKLCFQRFKIIGQRIDCKLNTPFDSFENPYKFNCELGQFENNTQYWTFEGDIPDIPIPEMMAQITTYRKEGNSWHAMYFLNETIDVCKHSGGRLSKVMINNFLPAMNNPEISNLNRPCPFKGPVYLRKFVFDGTFNLPRNLGGEWLLEMKFFVEGLETFTFDMNIYAQLVPIGLF